jgi:hypothetical protein
MSVPFTDFDTRSGKTFELFAWEPFWWEIALGVIERFGAWATPLEDYKDMMEMDAADRAGCIAALIIQSTGSLASSVWFLCHDFWSGDINNVLIPSSINYYEMPVIGDPPNFVPMPDITDASEFICRRCFDSVPPSRGGQLTPVGGFDNQETDEEPFSQTGAIVGPWIIKDLQDCLSRAKVRVQQLGFWSSGTRDVEDGIGYETQIGSTFLRRFHLYFGQNASSLPLHSSSPWTSSASYPFTVTTDGIAIVWVEYDPTHCNTLVVP